MSENKDKQIRHQDKNKTVVRNDFQINILPHYDDDKSNGKKVNIDDPMQISIGMDDTKIVICL